MANGKQGFYNGLFEKKGRYCLNFSNNTMYFLFLRLKMLLPQLF